jgi:four helix bundle protein
MKSFKELIVWQKSRVLAVNIYKLTSKYPTEEKYGLVSQLRRCSISVPSNIAEGWGRNSDGNFDKFLKISKGSLAELETQIIISFDLGFIDEIELNKLDAEITEIFKMLVSLIDKISHKK